MTLYIDGRAIEATPGKSLLDLLCELELDTTDLLTRPLAAKLAGEVFNLNYIPVREKDADPDRPSIRRAMAASGGQVRLLRFSDQAGKEVYTRTAQFVLFLALHRLWPEARAKMNCTLGAGLFVSVTGTACFSAEKLKAEVAKLVEMDIPLLRRRISTADAVAHFKAAGQEDKARLLSWREEKWFDHYSFEDYFDYFWYYFDLKE